MYMIVKHIHNMYMMDSQFKHDNPCTCHVHVLNDLIIKIFIAVLPYHVHVCTKF